jgi:hypothetical protein
LAKPAKMLSHLRGSHVAAAVSAAELASLKESGANGNIAPYPADMPSDPSKLLVPSTSGERVK